MILCDPHHELEWVSYGGKPWWPPSSNEMFACGIFSNSVIHSGGDIGKCIILYHLILFFRDIIWKTTRYPFPPPLSPRHITVVVQELVVEFNLVVHGVHDVLVLMGHIVNHAAVQHFLGHICRHTQCGQKKCMYVRMLYILLLIGCALQLVGCHHAERSADVISLSPA